MASECKTEVENLDSQVERESLIFFVFKFAD